MVAFIPKVRDISPVSSVGRISTVRAFPGNGGYQSSFKKALKFTNIFFHYNNIFSLQDNYFEDLTVSKQFFSSFHG
ncbi:MAG: hypothetical protein COT43_03825 [Candidatus Marinimicrobia bacterium CG08_land_8_20_14_0_20_45_22]|nr:MAG: hypothetical protein COT43_03825 [Candidatus Marinimicrobia bacterium CG08_land_8_20_14_0_20_45_22]